MIEALKLGLKDARRRATMAIGRAVLTVIDDTMTAQSLQLTLLSGETAEGIERFQEYGYTSVPHSGAEAVMACVGGLRSHGIVVAVEDRRYRLKGLAAGEVALYDDLGQKVHLTRAGIVIDSPLKVTVTSAVEVDVTAPAVTLGATGGPAVARVGDPVDLGAGTISGGSAKVTAA
jgi:phage baseplate assembly protein V